MGVGEGVGEGVGGGTELDAYLILRSPQGRELADGFFSLYRGLFANYLKVIPAVSISFVVFEATKTELERTFGKR